MTSSDLRAFSETCLFFPCAAQWLSGRNRSYNVGQVHVKVPFLMKLMSQDTTSQLQHLKPQENFCNKVTCKSYSKWMSKLAQETEF